MQTQPRPRPAIWFGDYVTQKVGSPKWVVARRTPRLEGRGHEAFISPAKYRALIASFRAEFPVEANAYFGAA